MRPGGADSGHLGRHRLVEFKDAAVIDAIRLYSADGSPRVHAVTIGELERGVAQATDEMTQSRRRATLRFAREQLAPVPLDSDGDQPEAFGQIATAVSRKISHNDTWITASAVTERRPLLTQNATLAEKAAGAATSGSTLHAWLSARQYRLEVIHAPRPST